MNVPVPVFRISGASGIVVFLYCVAMFGAIHLLATSKPNHPLSRAWLALGF